MKLKLIRNGLLDFSCNLKHLIYSYPLLTDRNITMPSWNELKLLEFLPWYCQISAAYVNINTKLDSSEQNIINSGNFIPTNSEAK